MLNDRSPDTVLSLRDELREYIPQDRIRVISLPPRMAKSGKNRVQLWNLTQLIYCHAVAELEPDVLLVASMFEGWGNELPSMFSSLPAHITRAVIAHDLIPYLDQKDQLSAHRIRAGHLRQMAEFKQAHRYLANSERTRQDLITHLQLKPETIRNISVAVSGKFQQMAVNEADKQALLERFGITRPFLLCKGALEPHKDLGRAIDAYSRLERGIRAGHQFVIVCPTLPGLEKTRRRLLQDHNLDDNEIIFTDRVSDEELVRLYNLCKAFVFPSVHEGFGLPLLEAMSCGAPTITSNAASLPEVIGWEEALFDPMSVESIQSKLSRVLTDEVFRKALAAHALRQSKQFDWNVTARKALEFMPAITQEHSPPRLHRDLIQDLATVVKSGSRLKDWQAGLLARSVALNDSAPKQPQILCDVSVLAAADAKTGIQRVVRNILSGLIKVTAKTYEVRPVVFRVGGFHYANTFAARCFAEAADKTHVEDLPVEPVPGSIYLALDLLLHNNVDYWQEVLRLRAWNIPCFFVVYDLIPIRFPGFFDVAISRRFVTWLKNITSHASGLVTISQATKHDLLLWMQENQIKQRPGLHISHFHLGADIQNDIRWSVPGDTPSVNLHGRPTFLVVSTIEPRKGHAQILDAFDQLWSKGHDLNLLFVGQRGWVKDEFISRLQSHPESGRRFHWLPRVSDIELDALYKKCDALVFASYAEGFGLAIVEAAQHGTPLILRDLPVFREVAGEHAFYFHADGPAELAAAVKEWLDLSKNGRAPSSLGVKCLTWEESTKMLLDSMGVVLETACSSTCIQSANTLS